MSPLFVHGLGHPRLSAAVFVLAGIVLLPGVSWPGTLAEAGAPAGILTAAPGEVTRTTIASLPDSVRLKTLSLLARGDVAGAIEYYLLATGAKDVPGWLRAFQAAFGAANQVAGKCQQVARNIFDAFSRLGGKPEFVRITAEGHGLRVMGFETEGGRVLQVAQNGLHVVVRFGGRIYDAFTGPAGMPASHYMDRLLVAEGMTKVAVVAQNP